MNEISIIGCLGFPSVGDEYLAVLCLLGLPTLALVAVVYGIGNSAIKYFRTRRENAFCQKYAIIRSAKKNNITASTHRRNSPWKYLYTLAAFIVTLTGLRIGSLSLLFYISDREITILLSYPPAIFVSAMLISATRWSIHGRWLFSLTMLPLTLGLLRGDHFGWEVPFTAVMAAFIGGILGEHCRRTKRKKRIDWDNESAETLWKKISRNT